MERFTQINQLRCHYDIQGDGAPIMLVHGWGQSMAFWHPLTSVLKNNYRVYSLDLPGFGLSQEPPCNWRIAHYADYLRSFSHHFGVENATIIGHSFGGRVSAQYAAEYGCRRLVLYSASGVPSFSKRKSVFALANRIGRYFIPNELYKFHCSVYKPSVYKNSLDIRKERSLRMLEIFLDLNKHNADLSHVFRRIQSRTLLLYGEKDTIVRMRVGERIHQLIQGSSLKKIPNATHFAHIEQPQRFNYELVSWLRS